MADEFRQDILEDNGLKSRKLWLTVFGILILAWAYWLAPWSSILPPLYTTFSASVIAILGLYFGVNAGHAFIASKTPESTNANPPKAPPAA
jgi:hypothetical protein